MWITLRTVISPNVTIEFKAAALLEAAGGIALRVTLPTGR